MDTAVELGYDGISLRGLGSVLEDLSQAEPFRPEGLETTLAELARRRLEICSVDTSVSFHDSALTGKMLEAGRTHIDLAARLHAGQIRVFGNRVPEGEARENVMSRIGAGLQALGEYAQASGVDVLLETHGDFTRGEDVRRIVEMADHPRVGVVWDVHHPYRHDGEAPAITYGQLGQYVRLVHLKDSRGDREVHTNCLQGEGDVPARECLRVLKAGGYDGWLVYEWEKRWRPEIPGPEEAFPRFIEVIRGYLAEL